MTEIASKELFQIFDARRVKTDELKGLDAMANVFWGWVQNRRPVLSHLKAQADRVEALEPEIQKLNNASFRDAIEECRDLARLNRLKGKHLDRALAKPGKHACDRLACGHFRCRSWVPRR